MVCIYFNKVPVFYCLGCYPSANNTWVMKKRETRKYALQRYLPKGIHTPAFIHIFRDYVGIMVITENQKTCIVIKDKEVAESYRQYFELLWKQAQETE